MRQKQVVQSAIPDVVRIMKSLDPDDGEIISIIRNVFRI
ncbi:hypothetical Protein YC6258_03301 [Gynuella sunshinyii YC6258]|uniref:Uncharacterized protein n=1 Tax=Gynuella sunshinyii YC6258 TaxID=1445510 RepID=A0A0C5VKY1_9GAMM|nr:hypothetical Protein YC6258_03301 [Gynuella sunshinyii YC6258]